MNNKHVVLNSDKFSFKYNDSDQLYYCTPSYEQGYVIVIWIGKDGLPEAGPEPITRMFRILNSGQIKVIELLKVL